jgi:hypothetical protein
MITRRSLFAVALIVCGLSFSGCALRAPQVDTVKRLLPMGGQDPRLAAYAWTLSFNGVSYLVYPIEAAGRRVVFANGNGLRLEWDGETIIVIDGVPGAFGRYESGVEGDERWYARAGSPAVRARCSPTRSWRLNESRYGWRQECSSASADRTLRSTHVVEFDRSGNISLIEASMAPGGSSISLAFIGQR